MKISARLSLEEKRALLKKLLQEQKSDGYRAPLSAAQRRVWFQERLDGAATLYNLRFALVLEGDLRIDVLKASLSELLARHDSLRTAFPVIDGEPQQEIAAFVPLKLPLVDLSDLTEDQREQVLAQGMVAEANRVFDTSSAPLWRFCLWRTAADRCLLQMTVHHLISDGISLEIMIAETMTCYTAMVKGDSSSLPPLDKQFADTVRQDNVQQAEHLKWWCAHLDGAPDLTSPPASHPRPSRSSYRGSKVRFHLDPSLVSQLRERARQNGATLYMTLLAGFLTLLARQTGRTDLVIGTPYANRNRDTADIIGFFVSTLAPRFDLGGNPDFATLIRRIRGVIRNAFAHRNASFDELVRKLQPPRSQDRHPIFQVAFMLQPASREEYRLPGLVVRPYEVDSGVAMLDLTLSMMETENGVRGYFEYAQDLFEHERIDAMTDQFRIVLERLVREPHTRINDFCLVRDEERQRLLDTWSTGGPTSSYQSFVARFDEMAARHPQRTALRCARLAKGWSYAGLSARVTQLTARLKATGVTAESVVAVLTGADAETALAFLAVLRAGGVYLPIDPALPEARRNLILGDAAPVIVLASPATRHLVPEACRSLTIDLQAEPVAQPDGELPPLNAIHADQAAYIIYTSGSTGTPKGVVISHGALANTVAAQRHAFPEVGTVLQLAAPAFDAAVWEMTMALAAGGCLLFAERETLPGNPRTWLAEMGVTHLTITPSLLASWPEEAAESLQTLIVAGETCPSHLLFQPSGGASFRQCLRTDRSRDLCLHGFSPGGRDRARPHRTSPERCALPGSGPLDGARTIRHDR